MIQCTCIIYAYGIPYMHRICTYYKVKSPRQKQIFILRTIMKTTGLLVLPTFFSIWVWGTLISAPKFNVRVNGNFKNSIISHIPCLLPIACCGQNVSPSCTQSSLFIYLFSSYLRNLCCTILYGHESSHK